MTPSQSLHHLADLAATAACHGLAARIRLEAVRVTDLEVQFSLLQRQLGNQPQHAEEQTGEEQVAAMNLAADAGVLVEFPPTRIVRIPIMGQIS